MYRYKIVFLYIYYCFKIWVNPWNFFQVNAKYFNKEKWIFSKYEIESFIPDKWKLKNFIIQFPMNNNQIEILEDQIWYPLFLKPEWGQNSHGIYIVSNRWELKKYFKNISRQSIPYIAQKSSSFFNEFELLFTNYNWNTQLLSFVESRNNQKKWLFINGIHSETSYHNLLDKLSKSDKEKIIWYIKEINHFAIGRIWLKANSLRDFIWWNFEIFEINIFLPFPLHLLDENISKENKNHFLHNFTKCLAQLSSNISTTQKNNHNIIFIKIRKHYIIKLEHNKYYMKIKKLIYAWIEKTFMNWCSDYNSIEVRRACRSKKQAREMFKQHNVPHAAWLVFLNPYTAYKFVEKHGFPIVLKPNVWGFSRGSHFPIENYADFWKAMFFVKLWWPTSVIEEYLLWKNYRVVATKWSVDIAMQRYPAFVVWNWEKTISELIDEENKIRVSMDLLPIIHEIEKSSKIKKHINKQWFTFDSVLENNKTVELYHRVSLAPGWVLETVETSDITEKNKKLFIDIIDMFDANIFGIDVIMEQGIDIDYDQQKCIFLEVNSRAYLEMHRKPRFWLPADLWPLHEKLSKIEIRWKGIF